MSIVNSRMTDPGDPIVLTVSVQKKNSGVFLCSIPVFLFRNNAEVSRSCTTDRGVATFGGLTDGTYTVVACGQSVIITVDVDDGNRCITIFVGSRNGCGFCCPDVAGINSCGAVRGCVGGCSCGCNSGCNGGGGGGGCGSNSGCGCGCDNDCGCGHCVGSIKILKFEAGLPCNGLRGAIFSLYDSCRRLVAKGITDKFGVLIFKCVPCGTFIVAEDRAPAGFVRDDTPQTVEVERCETAVLEFSNTRVESEEEEESENCFCRRRRCHCGHDDFDDFDDVSDVLSGPCCGKCGSKVSSSKCPTCNCTPV